LVASEAPLILIAERDKTVRDLQTHFLNKAGFKVEFLDDGEAALEMTRLVQPVLLITEILLPKIDGLTLCRRLREDPGTQTIPIIVFTMLAAAARASDAGASAFLRKPLVESVFLATVREVIAAQPNARMEQQWASK
jgi:CheY-like chemotaxis protein